ncbi:unnamed protein product, partial [Mesorhabditis belari]|uniref:Actin-interacting protein 1 n=1 Tax=Mesorhabditis belari TaxID=2138241 RepID=A0AAF3F2L0_9BILA
MAEEYTAGRTFPSLPRTVRGQPVVLGASAKGDELIYCAGNSVFTVRIADNVCTDVYTEHSHQTTVCKQAPSGFYNASCDSVGNVRLWDTTQKTHILKNQFQMIAGPIRDLCWSDDSKRLAVVGEGRERFGHAILFDTGTSNGDLSGQSRPVSSIDIRPVRPYRLITGSEDNTVAIFEGPPFKFKTLFNDIHTRFVWVTRYAPDGQLFASAGADGKVVLFEGTNGEKKGELVDEKCKGAAHGGSAFGLAWSPCGQKIATASGDKTVKIWNVPEQKLEHVVNFGNTVEDQQLSVLWTKTGLLSVNLAGFVHSIDGASGNITRVIYGHNKPITNISLSSDKGAFFTSDSEGHITRWILSSGESKRITPQIHKTQVSGMAIGSNGTLVTVGFDDTINFSILADDAQARAHAVKLPSQPLGVAVSKDGTLAVVACNKKVVAFKNGNQLCDISTNYVGTCIAVAEGKGLVAVGGDDSKVHIYSLSSTFNALKELAHTGAITAVSFSNDEEHLAATDSNRKVVPYSVAKDFASVNAKEWTFHTARANCVAWSPSGRRVATGGIDTNVIVWDLENSGEHPIIIRAAHPMSPVNGVVWASESLLLSIGQDANIKEWNLNLQ